MNSEYERRLSTDELKARNRADAEKPKNLLSSAPPSTPTQPMHPIVIQCPLPQAMRKLTQQADGINWELEEIRNMLPELKTHTDLSGVQRSLTEMQKSLTEMNELLERVGSLRRGNIPPSGSTGSRTSACWWPQVDHADADPWHSGTGGLVWRGGDPRPVPLMPAVAGLAVAGTLMDEDEDAEEKRRRMEAKIAAENLGAVIGFAAGAALAMKGKLDEQAAQEEQKKQQQQTMGGL